MKLLIFAVLSIIAVCLSQETCPGGISVTEGASTEFKCTPNGVIFNQKTSGFRCNEADFYYDADEQKCSEVNCANMDCVGKANEQFFNNCESGAREDCECSDDLTRDCAQGCLCKNGFCRVNGKCVKRDCVHPYYQ